MRTRRWTDLARALALLSPVMAAGCAAPGQQMPMSHVDRVIEDVTAMIEGMVQAHSRPHGLAQIAPPPRS